MYQMCKNIINKDTNMVKQYLSSMKIYSKYRIENGKFLYKLNMK